MTNSHLQGHLAQESGFVRRDPALNGDQDGGRYGNSDIIVTISHGVLSQLVDPHSRAVCCALLFELSALLNGADWCLQCAITRNYCPCIICKVLQINRLSQ